MHFYKKQNHIQAVPLWRNGQRTGRLTVRQGVQYPGYRTFSEFSFNWSHQSVTRVIPVIAYFNRNLQQNKVQLLPSLNCPRFNCYNLATHLTFSLHICVQFPVRLAEWTGRLQGSYDKFSRASMFRDAGPTTRYRCCQRGSNLLSSAQEIGALTNSA